jgi:hypothetical protein
MRRPSANHLDWKTSLQKFSAHKAETPVRRILTAMEGSLAKQLVELLVSYETAGRQFNTGITRSRDCSSSQRGFLFLDRFCLARYCRRTSRNRCLHS